MSLKLETSPAPLDSSTGHPRASRPEAPVLVIEPRAGWSLQIAELWRYRELFGFLVWREIKIRYAQTILGAGWAILQPVLTMLVFTVIFGNFAKISTDGVPGPAFYLAGLVLWTYFATAITNSSASLVSSANLITKIYFPRLVIPLAPVLAGLVDFVIAFGVLLLVVLGFGLIPLAAAMLVVPASLLIVVLTATGVGCWLSALNLRYRDVRYVVPFLVQVWMYASPVVYPMSILPARLHAVYALNPLVGAVEGFRAAVLGTTAIPWLVMGISLITALLLFVSGVFYFRWTERFFADVV